MRKHRLLLTCTAIALAWCALAPRTADAQTLNFGDLAIVGDSITQGGNANPSYRYPLFQSLIDADATFNFVGSITGAFQFNAGSTPDYMGQPFNNVHEGHWGWRAFWENGRVPLPSNRTSGNCGTGTIENWTGQTTQYASNTPGNLVTYTGQTYVPDTVIAMIGINDLTGGSSTATLLDDVERMVEQYQTANAGVEVYLTSLLTLGSGHSQVPAINNTVAGYNADLNDAVSGWSTTTSTVRYIDITTGFNANTMTYDNVHPNAAGEQFVATQIARGIGLFGMPGDANGDGRVDAADLDVLLATWGDTVQADTGGDFDGDGTVGSADLDIAIAHFGEDAVAGSTLPEPGTLMILALGGLVLGRRKR